MLIKPFMNLERLIQNSNEYPDKLLLENDKPKELINFQFMVGLTLRTCKVKTNRVTRHPSQITVSIQRL